MKALERLAKKHNFAPAALMEMILVDHYDRHFIKKSSLKKFQGDLPEAEINGYRAIAKDLKVSLNSAMVGQVIYEIKRKEILDGFVKAVMSAKSELKGKKK